ncbi:amino acid ABC transporter substrate-binding protein [Paraburkholderia sediminicola]|uniref:amino acid ABC transporter substrate-binding protein n=1 Tax=Paraburkholderia sediminicola TaxID=458836 RepID=UPI0038B9A763
MRIGFSIGKTGIFAAAAPSELNSYELWREQVNAAGGLSIGGKEKRPVEFVVYDDQSDPAQAARIYEKLITQDKVDLVMAPYGTPTHVAVVPVLERYKMPMVGNTAASAKLRGLNARHIWFVTGAFPDRVASGLVQMMKASNVKSVALLVNVSPFSKEVQSFLEPALKAQGIQTVVSVEYPPDIKDMTVQLLKVKAAHPEAVLSLSYPADSTIYVQQAKELGIATPFQFVLLGPGASFFPKLLGSATNNILMMGDWAPTLNPMSKQFYDAYRKKYKEAPDYLDSAETYASCQVLEAAVARAGLDRDKLTQAIASGQFDTILGNIRFDGVENRVTRMAVLQMRDGHPELVWPPEIATSKYQPKTGWQ